MSTLRDVRRARLGMAMAAAQSASSTSASVDRDLEVTAIDLFPLREPGTNLSYTVVRVTTRAGMKGYGECARASASELDAAKLAVVGRPASAFEIVRGRLAGLPAVQAAVNMALLDILGKAAKAPLYQVLGGPTRNKVRAMTALDGSSDTALMTSFDRARKSGFRAFLVPTPKAPGRTRTPALVQATRKRLEELRKAGGDQTDFVLDGAGDLSAGEAGGLCGALELAHLLWIDEPCRTANLGILHKLANDHVTPVGFGRNIHKTELFQDLLREQAIDVLRPDICLNGITQIRRMAALAETYYTAVAPHHTGGPIGTAAALHLAASLPNFFIQSIPLPEANAARNMRSELTGGSVEAVKDGFAALPTRPGLGIQVNEIAFEKYKERA